MTHAQITKLYHQYRENDNSKHRSKNGIKQDPIMKAFMAGFSQGWFLCQEESQLKCNQYLDKKGI